MNLATGGEFAGELDTGTPILVLRRSLNPFQHCALAIARSAGRLGVPVHSICADPGEPAMRSRYLTSTVPMAAELPEADWIEALIALRPRLDRAMLLPIDDLAAVTVGDHQDRLAEHYLIPLAPAGIRRLLASKRELHALCLRLGLATPASSFPADETEFIAHAAEMGYPVVLKRAEPWLPPRRPDAPSVFIAHTPDQALQAYREMESDVAPQVMVQDYVPGDSDSVWMFNGYAGEAGRCLCSFTARKLRQRGPRTGPTTLGECAHNETVSVAAQRLLSELDYRGIVDMGFRYDRRDGLYKLLDVNPRLGSTFRLFTAANGVDVVRAMHLDMTARPVPPSQTLAGRTWIDERSDPVTAVQLIREGSLSVRSWMGSLRRIDEAAWWARDDPRPFIAMCAQSGAPAARMLAGGRSR
jgi:predicted ATP-grasp superfamily ATP-dependent carboligase